MAKGNGRIVLELDGISRRTRAVAVRNLKESLTLLRDETRKALRRTQGAPGYHSKPGKIPYRQTGNLAAGVVYELDEARLEGRVISTAPYSSFLENGTPRMAARPFLGPTYRRLRTRITEILQRRK
jgi:HK97 gp10 family phage protein